MAGARQIHPPGKAARKASPAHPIGLGKFPSPIRTRFPAPKGWPRSGDSPRIQPRLPRQPAGSGFANVTSPPGQ